MFEGDQCCEKQETKEGIKISGVGRIEILQRMSWQTIMKVIFEQELKNIRAKTCRYLEKQYSRKREQLELGA